MRAMETTIEPARAGDEAAMLGVFQSVSIETYRGIGQREENLRSYVVDSELVTNMLDLWHGITSGAIDHPLYVARDESAVIGYGHSSRDDQGNVFLEALYTAQRGRRVGSRLLQAVLQPFVGENVHLNTTAGTAEGFYRKHGFEQVFLADHSELTGVLVEALKYGVVLPQVAMIAKPYNGDYQVAESHPRQNV